MTDLTDFGGGILSEKKDDAVAHDTRTERAKHRRRQYRLGRCRGVSISKGTRCGGGIIEDSDGPYCYYHGLEAESPIEGTPITIDDAPAVLARRCGLRPVALNEMPDAVVAALRAAEDSQEVSDD